ncbi:MAG: proline--tRNA ligase [Candidatus Omnitrophica bacterium]|nr:proline--tRNA ligase [Candidatus Omnitrophota bacterium]
MRWSDAFIPTLREDPKDAEAISHKLMVRAGLIRRLGSGAYSYLPLGFRVLHNVIRIVREEMSRAGAQEVLLPALQPMELWSRTGRDKLLGDVLIRFKDRTGKEMALGPTHEEVITTLVAEVKSHRQLPLTLYQIQTKFRDEPRPRGGVIRSKEFIMKDAYSFDADADGLNASYQRMFECYQRIFARCGLSVLACEASSGMMGGDVSHEFMAPSDSGEDVVVRCESCGYAANLEAAKCQKSEVRSQKSEQPKPIEEVATPGKHTVEQVSQFFKVSPSGLIKTLLYTTDKEPVAVVVRGDHDVNEAKLARLLNAPQLKLADAAAIQRLTGAPVGFTGPVKLTGVRLLADHAVMGVVNGVAGANKDQAHLRGVNPGRDFTPAVVADLRVAVPGDPCAACGKPLAFVKAIEVGHVFKLGTKYSQALGATFQDEGGQAAPMIMGCYGVGINRIAAAAIEQRHDKDGIIWPPALSPFDAIVTVLEATDAKALKAGEEATETLGRAGLDVLLDDREQSPGSKLKDADLIGIPVQVVIGKVWASEGRLEVVARADKSRQKVEPAALVPSVERLLAPPFQGKGGA